MKFKIQNSHPVILMFIILIPITGCHLLDLDKEIHVTNYALLFDGNDDIIVINNPDDNLDNLRTYLTIQCWLKTDTIPNEFAYVLDRTDYSASYPLGDRFQLSLRQESQSVHFNVNSCGLMSPAIKLNKWYNVAVVFNGQMMFIYIDGELSASLIQRMDLDVNESIMTIGNETGLTRPFSGYLDELSIWNRALSQSQIQANIDENPSYPRDGLIAYYPILNKTDTLLVDVAGQNTGIFGLTQEDNINSPAIIDVGLINK